MGLLLLAVCVGLAGIFFELINGLADLSWLVLIPMKWLLGMVAIALLTWLSGD